MSGLDLVALCGVKGADWSFLAREAQRSGGLENLLAGRASERSPDATETLAALQAARVDFERHREWVERTVAQTAGEGIGLTTILDDDYPINLRTIYNPPPFLFCRRPGLASHPALRGRGLRRP